MHLYEILFSSLHLYRIQLQLDRILPEDVMPFEILITHFEWLERLLIFGGESFIFILVGQFHIIKPMDKCNFSHWFVDLPFNIWSGSIRTWRWTNFSIRFSWLWRLDKWVLSIVHQIEFNSPCYKHKRCHLTSYITGHQIFFHFFIWWGVDAWL